MRLYLVFICLVAAAGGFLFGFDTSVISGAIEFIASPDVFDLDEVAKGWTVGCILIGCMVGCVFTGHFSQKYGRKIVLIFTALIFLFSSLGCALAESHTEFVIYRIVAGVAVGAASMLSPIYIAEVAPAKHRGKLGVLNILAIFLGQSVAFFSNFFLKDFSGVDNWRWMMGIMSIPSIVLLLLLFFIPESPRWLVRKKKSETAYQVLIKISNLDTAKKELYEIEKSLQLAGGKLIELFKQPLVKLLLIGISLAVLQQITGINVIMYYAPSIFRSAGFGTDSALYQTAIMGIVNLSFAGAAMFFVDKVGRKPLMIIGAVGMGVSLVLLSMTFLTNNFQGYFVLICIMCFLAFLGFSMGPVVWILISEIFPNRLRSHAVAISFFFLWLADFVISSTFPYLLANLKGYVFLVYAWFCFVCLVFVLKFVKETKGKSLEQIETELTGVINDELIKDNSHIR